MLSAFLCRSNGQKGKHFPIIEQSNNIIPASNICGIGICTGRIHVPTLCYSGTCSYTWQNTAGNQGQGTYEDGIILNNLCPDEYTIVLSDGGCAYTIDETVAVTVGGNGGGGEQTGTIPEDVELRVYPTVFDGSTFIKYTLPADSKVTLKIYNMLGIPVKTVVDEEVKEAGEYILPNEGYDLNNGLYFYSIKVCDEIKTEYGIKY